MGGRGGGGDEGRAGGRKGVAWLVPGVRIELIQGLPDMLGDLEGNPEPIEVKLFGDDEAELRRQAQRVADAIKDIAIPDADLNSDIHASAEYRAHLVTVMARRAVAACV
mgnify:CR=1 FL=1